MFYRIIYFIAVLPFFMQCTPVQRIEVKSIEWKIAAQIPSPDNTAAALGLASTRLANSAAADSSRARCRQWERVFSLFVTDWSIRVWAARRNPWMDFAEL